MNCIRFIFLIYETEKVSYISSSIAGYRIYEFGICPRFRRRLLKPGYWQCPQSRVSMILSYCLLQTIKYVHDPLPRRPACCMHQASVSFIYFRCLRLSKNCECVCIQDWRMSRIPKMEIHIGYVCVNIFNVGYILQFCERRNLFCSL